MKQKFLVTGGNGFIGSAIVEMLLKEGNQVTILDNIFRHKKKSFSNNQIEKKIKFINGNICNYKQVLKSAKDIDTIIHLAYINGTKNFYLYPNDVIEVATKGLINVFDACKHYNIKEIYLASSSEVYHHPLKIPTDENESLKIPDPYNPRFSYACGKILTEIYGISFAKFFKKLVIFRPHNVFGPNMGNEHVVPELINKIYNLKKNNLKIEGTGKETRSFIFIKDFVEAFKLILKKGKHKNIYNIGNEDEILIQKLVYMISKNLNKKINISKGSLKKGGTIRRCPKITKLKKLGYNQNYSFQEGLNITIDWYKNNYEKEI